MTTSNGKNDKEEKGWQNSGLMNFSDKEKQTIFKIFGIEMTAPKGLKNPGTIFASLIFVNILFFILLRNFIAG